jgi:hypothetical protein
LYPTWVQKANPFCERLFEADVEPSNNTKVFTAEPAAERSQETMEHLLDIKALRLRKKYGQSIDKI